MSQEFQAVIALLHNAILELFPDRKREMSTSPWIQNSRTIDWEIVRQIARRHRVLPMVARGLSVTPTLKPTEEFVSYLQDYTREQAHHALTHVSEVLGLLELFNSLNLTVLPYKGPFLSLRGYGDLAAREFSDLDVLISLDTIPVLEEALIARGYRPVHEIPEGCRRAYFKRQPSFDFEKWNGNERVFRLEPHYLSVDPVLGKGASIDSFNRQLDRIELAGREIHALTPEAEFVLMVTHHGCHEAWGGLRYLVDVSVWLNRFGHQMNWDWIEETLDRSGWTRLTAIGIAMAEKLFGKLPVPDSVRKMVSAQATVKMSEEQIDRLEWYPIRHNTRSIRFGFLFRALDSYLMKLGLVVRHFARIFQPVYEDFEWTNVPGNFYPLYYLVRPVRLVLSLLRKKP